MKQVGQANASSNNYGKQKQYDNMQDFLGEANISAINPTMSDMNLRNSQQSLMPQNIRESMDKYQYSNFADRFAALDQLQMS